MSALFAVLLAVSAQAHDPRHDTSAERVDVIEVDAREGDQVDVRSTNGHLEVEVDPSLRTATLTAEVSASGRTKAEAKRDLERIDVVFERRGGVLYAAVEVPDGVSGGGHLTLRLPDAGRAELRTDNGRVDVTGVDGDVVVTTHNGGVEVRDTEGAVTVRTDNGGIDVLGADGPVDVRTSNGRVELHDIGASVSATSTNGGIEAQLRPTAAGPAHLSTTNGSVSLVVGPAFNGEVRVDTSMGSVRVEDRAGRATARGDVWIIGEGGEQSRVESSLGSVLIEIGG